MLYAKHLKNIEELKAEKKRLSKKIKKESQGTKKSDNSVTLQQALKEQVAQLDWGNIISTASQIILPYFIQKESKKLLIQKGKNIAGEVFMGYAKWKLLSFTFSMLFKSAKNKKKQKEA